MSSYMWGALVAGLIIGAIPAIAGGVKGKLALGLAGLAACVIGSVILGMILSIPLCAIFIYLIFKKDEHHTTPIHSTSYQQQDAQSTDESNHSVSEQIMKLSELRDAGVLTEEEFQQKRLVLCKGSK